MKSLRYLVVFVAITLITGMASNKFSKAKAEFPKTDFSNYTIELNEIVSGGPPRDGIKPIDKPKFIKANEIKFVQDNEPVITIDINGSFRAYPLSVLMHHEIVNDTVQGRNLAITYCPLCNSSRVFIRDFKGQTLDFGTTGKVRNSDLIMYDRQTETWWQQFTGEGIIGKYAGERLRAIPARIESLKKYKERAGSNALVLSGDKEGIKRNYGINFYYKYDSSDEPFLAIKKYKGSVPALSRVVAVGDKAWSLDYLKLSGTIRSGDLIITRTGGQSSALDERLISEGKDIGNVVVKRIINADKVRARYRNYTNKNADQKLLANIEGELQDVIYDVPFAFAFKAFYPNSKIITE